MVPFVARKWLLAASVTAALAAAPAFAAKRCGGGCGV